MRTPKSSPLLILLPSLFLSISFAASTKTPIHHLNKFLQCLSQFGNTSSISKVIYTQTNPSYASILESPVENLRFTTAATPKPLVIVTPFKESQIQAAIICSKKYDMQIRARSGAHDYEGLSYVAHDPFVVIDLRNFHSIDIDLKEKTAWVQAGATIGELYYNIAQKSRNLGFPAGVCPTVGVGGHISGGGWGVLFRKHGLAADNIIDARLINSNGTILQRRDMGEDLFWAIRGGGGGSFGVILAWKIKLIAVPPVMTVFSINRTLAQDMTKLVYRWQYIADRLPQEVFSRLSIRMVNAISQDTRSVQRTIQATFSTLYLGGVERLLSLMRKEFPELGVQRRECFEMSWIESTLYASRFPFKGPLEVLLRRTPLERGYIKTKSDYVKQPIPISGLEGLWRLFYEAGIETPAMFLTAFGGKMNEIEESRIPFPHRAGNKYQVQYFVTWGEEGTPAQQRHIGWIRRLYNYMTPYVSKSPRASYINYRDLDIGTNDRGKKTSYQRASIWGKKYFKNNFDRLVQVKSKFDPENFFWNEQSIPSLHA